MTDVKVTEIQADGSTVDKSGVPIPKVRASDTLSAKEIEALIKAKQKPSAP